MTGDFHVLVPLKRLDGAKSRLAELLSPAVRAELMQAMLADVLAAVREAPGVAGITLVSSEPAAASFAGEHDIGWWNDRGLPWNDALLAAMREAVTETSVAVVSADIPLVVAEEVEALLAATPGRGIAIARASDGGTNAVALRPTAALKTCFGSPGSAELHARQAREAKLESVILDRPGLALDLDTPEDVERFLEVDRPTRTGTLLSLTLTREVPA